MELKTDDVPHFSELLTKVGPYMRQNGTVIGFYMKGGRPADAPIPGQEQQMWHLQVRRPLSAQ